MKTLSLVKRSSRGKTIKIDLTIDEENKVIKDIVVSGDFFAYPPEKLEELEDKLKNKHVSEVDRVIDEYRDILELVGASLDDLRELVKKAFQE